MIHSFSAKNFYSIDEPIEINFEVNKNAPATEAYIRSKAGGRLTKILTIVGPNASGKTNILKIIPFLSYFISNSSYDLKTNETIPFLPFLLSTSAKDPSELSTRFELAEKLYEYRVQLSNKQVFFESLRIFNKETKQFSILFQREWDSRNKVYKINLKKFKVPSKFKVRSNGSLISLATQIEGHELSQEIAKYWDKLNTNVAEWGKHHHNEATDISEAAKFYLANPQLKNQAENLLSRFDLGLNKIDLRKLEDPEGKGKDFYIPEGIHIKGDKVYPLPFRYESGGTKNLFILLTKILKVLSDGGIAVLDEFDADLHPNMLPELLNLFILKNSNPNNAQLFFSSHHHEILNKLDKYQIIFVQKNTEKAQTETWRLDQIEGVRVDDNYYAKYISGVYGATPDFD